jgi:hypothetical protein
MNVLWVGKERKQHSTSDCRRGHSLQLYFLNDTNIPLYIEESIAVIDNSKPTMIYKGAGVK